jgi:ribosome-associated protein
MKASADPPSAARTPVPIAVELPITLGQFLKLAGLAGTGGEAKHLIVSGHIMVNGQTELHRGRHLTPGDIVVTLGGAPVSVACDSVDS